MSVGSEFVNMVLENLTPLILLSVQRINIAEEIDTEEIEYQEKP
jgi:hypothetical protein